MNINGRHPSHLHDSFQVLCCLNDSYTDAKGFPPTSPPLRFPCSKVLLFLLVASAFLKNAIINLGERSLSKICISKMSSPKQPLCPKFISLENEENNIRVNSDGFRFRVVSYNILAQVYVKSSFFPHTPSPCLNLTSLLFSAELVLEEKIEYNDLVDLVKNETTVTVNKTSDAIVGGNEEVAPHAEGSPPKNGPSDTVDPNDPRVRLKRDCVGLMAAFKLRNPSSHLVIVANTHIYWDPEWIDVKLAQAKYLLFRLAQFKKMVSNKFDCTPSVILCGDFNSTPGDMVYQFLISGNSSAMPVSEHSEDAPIPLSSVYAFIGGEPPFTNCTPDFTNTLDYIFFSPTEGLRPVSFLELPGPESSDVIGGLPNYDHPSDHLPIGTDFEIIRT
ncbi:carbon catabolite repressor protein 4 homolog 4-like [Macadamia integrifolia]|uniref:carbon catabolite repressor protein 4 homolog 4-like n=1 Tax=Macadamia integrifolia TaxID=60698 RepID=UPI001C4F0BA9|nr:carbon catabolite repressor protein 4 homolog 4-like [Macadamia integrifolia]